MITTFVAAVFSLFFCSGLTLVDIAESQQADDVELWRRDEQLREEKECDAVAELPTSKCGLRREEG